MMKTAIKKFLLVILLLLALSVNNVVRAIRCGTPLTTACVGATDIRYDPDASNDVNDQAVIWEKTRGLFVGGGVFRVNTLAPLTGPIPSTPDPSVPIISIPFYEFVNRTNDGARRIAYSYYMAPLAPLPEKVSINLAYGTTSYEKDGTLVPFLAIANDVSGEEVDIPTARKIYPVDENTEYYSIQVSGLLNGISNAIRVCLDVNCDRYDGSTNVYQSVNSTIIRVFADEWSLQRVDTAEEWYAAIYARYNESNIPLDQRLDPTVDICDLGLCPTEAEWCKTDPNCSESPYQEPPASVRGDVIAGFTIAGIVILVAVLYGIHRYLLARQAQRYRTVFAKRIADTIEVRGSMRGLPPDALVEEFNRIDAGVKDGKLSKEEMWEFVSSGKAGEMDRKDFDALFAAIDLDGSGNIDFLEFCAFMGKCHDEYRAARVDRGSIVARRVSAVSTAFVKVPEDEAGAGA